MAFTIALIQYGHFSRDKNTTIICNGRGECNCGKCTCRERQKGTSQFYTGTFCECDDYSCPYFSGLICGGETVAQWSQLFMPEVKNVKDAI